MIYKNHNRGFAPIALLIALVAVLGVGGAGYGYVKYQEKQNMGKATMPKKLPEQSNATLPEKNPHASGVLPGSSQPQRVLTQAEAEALVLATWGGCTPDMCNEVVVSIEAQGAVYKVTAIYTSLRDDSVADGKKEAIATFQNGSWVLGQPTDTFRCHLGRGHQDFSTVLCN